MFFAKQKQNKEKIKPNFFKIFYFYVFGSSLFLCLKKIIVVAFWNLLQAQIQILKIKMNISESL